MDKFLKMLLNLSSMSLSFLPFLLSPQFMTIIVYSHLAIVLLLSSFLISLFGFVDRNHLPFVCETAVGRKTHRGIFVTLRPGVRQSQTDY